MKSLCPTKIFCAILAITLAGMFCVAPPKTYATVTGGAGKILLSPANTTLPIGTTTSVDLLFNTANIAVSGVQAVLSFTVASPVDLQATIQVNTALSDAGWSFPIKTVTTTGTTTTIELMALNLNAEGYAVNTDTKLATLVFTSQHPFSNKAVLFDQSLTKLLKKSDATDFFGIPSNGGYSTSGVASTPTQIVNSPTSTPTGNNAPTCSTIASNTSSANIPVTLTLTCTGSDTDGTITAADFTFGDGTSPQIVESNVGKLGSISTTHYYTTLGAVKATCKVKDNTGTWSTVSGACEKILSFKPKLTPTATPIRISTATPIRATITSKGTVTPTPIRIVTSVISDTPDVADPNIQPEAEPTLYPEAETENVDTSSNRIWWIIGGIVAMLLAFLLLRRKGPPQPPQGQVPITSV